MIDEDVKRGMESTFRRTLGEHPEFVPILLRTFACIVYHSDGLIKQMVWCPGHDFAKLAVLHDRELLTALKLLVTIDRTEGAMAVWTGIPPHVNHARQLAAVMDVIGTLVNTVASQNQTLVSTVTTALEDWAFESGHVTGDCLKSILCEYKDDTIRAVNLQLDTLQMTLISIGGERWTPHLHSEKCYPVITP